jgi:hypothetical protein
VTTFVTLLHSIGNVWLLSGVQRPFYLSLVDSVYVRSDSADSFNSLNAQLNPICHLLALLGARHILHVSRLRVNDYVHFDTLLFFRSISRLIITEDLSCHVRNVWYIYHEMFLLQASNTATFYSL